MKRISKFPLAMTENQVIEMPAGSKVLCALTNYEIICLFVIADEDEPATVKRRFRIIGTEHAAINADMWYLGTCQLRGGREIYSVFETPFVEEPTELL